MAMVRAASNTFKQGDVMPVAVLGHHQCQKKVPRRCGVPSGCPLPPFWADFTPKQMRKAWSILAAGSASAKAAAPPAVVSAALTPCPQLSSHLHGDLQGCTFVGRFVAPGLQICREKQLSPSGCDAAGAPRLGCGCPSPAVSVLCSHNGWPCLWLPPPHRSFAPKCS